MFYLLEMNSMFYLFTDYRMLKGRFKCSYYMHEMYLIYCRQLKFVCSTYKNVQTVTLKKYMMPR